MTARLIDGKAIAQSLRAEIAAEAASYAAAHGVRPGLAAILVGENHPGGLYVRNKVKACAEAGIASFVHELPGSTTSDGLRSLIHLLNDDPSVHGILVQLPLPKHIPEEVALEAIAPLKDVDAFGESNVGRLASGNPRFAPCTPAGIIEMLRRENIATAGKHVVIVGRSNIVGKPLALMLLQKGVDATVTVCHSRTPDVGALTKQADIVVMAVGIPEMLKADMVKPGAVVIDVGTNRRADKTWVGDADFAGVSAVASAITPVPGGVGPMTITMLLANTLKAAKLLRG